jgi:hypothetical protein
VKQKCDRRNTDETEVKQMWKNKEKDVKQDTTEAHQM